jgi:ATP-dependent Clp protease ATP-binding subunit ClpC
MVNFHLKKASISRALFFDKIVFFKRANVFSKIFLFFFLFFLILFYAKEFFEITDKNFLPLSVFSFILFLFFAQIELFFEEYIKKTKNLISVNEGIENIEKINIADFLSFESAVIIEKTNEKGGVDSFLLLYYLLKEAKDMDFVFYRILIDKEQAMRDLENIFDEREKINNQNYSDCFLRTMADALYTVKERKGEKITNEDIFVALGEHNDYLKNLLYRAGLRRKDVFDLVTWQLKSKEKENPFLYKNLIKRGRLGIEWASGYTPFLENFAIDWTRAMKFSGFPETIGHEKGVEALERILSRDDMNSVVLVGEPGSGRKSIVQKIIKKSFLGEALEEINYKRFLELDLPSLLAYADGIEETERFLDEIFQEATRAGNIVLIINNFHNFVGGEQRPGIIDISGIISSYLHIPDFKIIGITSYLGFRRNIEANPSILSLIEKVEVKEATEEDTLLLLQRKSLVLERRYKILISFVALKKIISLSARYIKNTPFPEKALDVLEEAMVYVNQKKEKILLSNHVEKIISEKTEIPVGEVDSNEKEILLNMENLIHERMVNQETAVKAISLALRRSRADVDTRRSLIGSFLFLGPTGVGKTEMARAIADIYFGTEKKVNRIDMSEFQSISDISRLIGSSSNEGILTSGVREDPFSLILLDEIEKSHPDILNLFLQVLDEGHLTDGMGRKVDFQNAMLIATSNAGYQTILNAVEKNEDWGETKSKILKNLFSKGVFRPEFVNRFDEVILFKSLTKEDLVLIAGLQLQKLVNTLKEKEINFTVTEELKKKIVDISYDPVFGAREMQRAIQNNIGDVLSSAILKEEIKSGDSFLINAEDFSIIKK